MDALTIDAPGKDLSVAIDQINNGDPLEVRLRWNDEHAEQFSELLKVADENRVSVTVEFDTLRPSHLSDVIFRYRYPRPAVTAKRNVTDERNLAIGSTLPMPADPLDYENARGMSLVSEAMQEFIQELRDALWVMRAHKQAPRMPWDPLDGQRSDIRYAKDNSPTLQDWGFPNLSAVFECYNERNRGHLRRLFGHANDGVRPNSAREPGWDWNIKLLVTGDSGTGKSLVARLAHRVLYPDDHHKRYFAHLNCSTLDAQNAEFEIFGAAPGTYTGVDHRVGALARAAYGTAFLDEFGDLPPGTGPILLTFLDDLLVRPRGMMQFFSYSYVVAATNRDLSARIRAGEFRNDLVQRFSRRIEVPPLRRRGRAEILALVDMACQNPIENPIETFRGKEGRAITEVAPPALSMLASHDYADGNVRELEAITHQAIQRAKRRNSSLIEPIDLDIPKHPNYRPDADQNVIRVGALPDLDQQVEVESLQDIAHLAQLTRQPLLQAPDNTYAVIHGSTGYYYRPPRPRPLPFRHE
ncbi:MAG: sigma 54-interacting transcriptional regulator [bacterium]|nr:sigma 54-interacting transcriptional regulator [bacterium]